MKTPMRALAPCIYAALIAALAAVPVLALGNPPLEGKSATHGSWTVACDNTGTCRAAGYAAHDAYLAHSATLLLIRRAGTGIQPVARLAIMPATRDAADRAAEVAEITRNDGHVALRLFAGEQGLGEVALDTVEAAQMDAMPLESNTLEDTQVPAIITALVNGVPIRLESTHAIRREISAEGAREALAFMDAFQRRTGTPSALVERGTRADTTVLQPVRVPPIPSVPLPRPGMEESAALQDSHEVAALAAIRQDALRRSRWGEDACDFLRGDDRPETPRLALQRLDAHRLLASTRCRMGATNSGWGYWVLPDEAPYTPVVQVTLDGSLDGDIHRDGRIISWQTGQRLDCGDYRAWQWGGQQFVLREVASTGFCRGFPGGAWWLPTQVPDEVERNLKGWPVAW